MLEKIYDRILFALQFLLHPIRNASVTPSSVTAAKAMVNGIDFTDMSTIVELGPGTGVFTSEILAKATPGTRVILIEIEKRYVDLLRKKFGDIVIVEHASVADLERIVTKHGGRVNLIVSGLPVVIHGVTEKFLESIKRYTDGGTIYRFFSYSPPRVRRIYRDLPVYQVTLALRNVPPLWVYGIN